MIRNAIQDRGKWPAGPAAVYQAQHFRRRPAAGRTRAARSLRAGSASARVLPGAAGSGRGGIDRRRARAAGDVGGLPVRGDGDHGVVEPNSDRRGAAQIPRRQPVARSTTRGRPAGRSGPSRGKPAPDAVTGPVRVRAPRFPHRSARRSWCRWSGALRRPRRWRWRYRCPGAPPPAAAGSRATKSSGPM